MNLLPPPPGAVNLGDLARLTPVSDVFGFDRGNPVDRHYIETFLARNAAAIRGRTLEIGDATYTQRFGGQRVTTSDVLHIHEGNPAATIVGDLTQGDHIPSDAFDCVILTQTLHLIFDVDAAVRTLHRILRPGGVLLLTVPGISQISRNEWSDTWYWSFTELSARRLFERVFGEAAVRVESWGNVLSATAFLQGLASRELRLEELEYRDAAYPVTIAVSAEKRAVGRARPKRIAISQAAVVPPRLSVILVHGNDERFIAEAMDSITVQTSMQWELLVVENGAGDCSPTLAARYEAEFPGRIRRMEYEGREGDPPDAVWRWALQQARGEYVARLDADHVWSPDVAAGLIATLDATPRAIAARAPSVRWQSWFESSGPADASEPEHGAPKLATHDRACASTLAARRVDLLRMASGTGPRSEALLTLDPRVGPRQNTDVALATIGRVECRVRDVMSACPGLALSMSPPVTLRTRQNGSHGAGHDRDAVPISVVICTRDRPDHIAACIEAALAQSHPAGEIVVVESAPASDASSRIIRHYPVRYRVAATPGLSHARNLGIASARFDIIAFTDDDARPDPDWLRGVAQAFSDPHVMAVTGLVLPAAIETPAQSLFEHACGGMGKGARPMTFAGASMSSHARMAAERMGVGANMAFRRETLERVGEFDPALGAGSPGRAAEDLDMFHRVVAAGLMLRYEPSAIVRHHHRSGMDELYRQMEDAAYGYASYLEKLGRAGTVSARSAAAFRARWYAWMLGRVGLGMIGLKEVPTTLLRSQLRTAMDVRRRRNNRSTPGESLNAVSNASDT